MPHLARALGARTATLLVVSSIVGSGVFKKVAPMADALGSPLWVLGCWVVAGVVSLAGALTYAEMAGLFPESGGEYVYFRRVYGPLMAFLYGWGAFAVMRTATVAALAHVFGQSVATFLAPVGGTPDWLVPTLATALIVALGALNYRGLVVAEGVSRALLYLTLVAVAGMAVVAFSSPAGQWGHFSDETLRPSGAGGSWAGAFFGAMLGAFWGYEGWNQITYLGEEIRQPQRNLPVALGVGTAIVMVLYVLLNLIYLYVLPIDALAALAATPDRIAAVEVVRHVAGPTGAGLMAGLILVTTTNANNASVMMPARLFYAMARDGLFFRVAARLHPRYQTPSGAIVLQGAWATVLVWSGSFDQLTDMLVFAGFIFYGATGVAVLWLRYRQPTLPRPFRVPGYPVVPLFFCAFCAGLILTTLVSQPREALTGLALIATGLPFYAYWRRRT